MKLDLASIAPRVGSGYPEPYAARFATRHVLPVGKAGGITQFGANVVTLRPGTASTLRHWHEEQDEFVIVLSGELMLAMDEGETPMGPGDCAAFPRGVANGHCLINRSDRDASFFVVGTHTPTERGHYSEEDLMVTAGPDGFTYTRKDGSPL
ncbi:cupin domain-containing protein [Seohaeicola zhoushanensis]|uniref:Transcriptional regulator n=1 Tax=Seohaeicola zhoushanensis TaxID=1569283 RepID=A0A8J3GZ35_9RHOB|nr:cupin domain-containing protein [Seohaeicola zhoushanensis]GHF61006.1 transcriptional regulator [Seohaeicola zhoushanensis]